VRPLLFDHTALMALFHGQPRVSRLFFWAEHEAVTVLLPAAAMGAANSWLKATDDAWMALLLTPNVEPLDLSPSGALAAARRGSDLAVGHTSVEAAATGGTIVTSIPEVYDRDLRIAAF
jgi:hypothetical protein